VHNAPAVDVTCSNEEHLMTLEIVRAALGWCAIINFALLAWWFLFFSLAHDWTQRVHGRWFRLSGEDFDRVHYMAMAYFKMGILLLNLVPYLALRIVA
jgi:hypothetical protein